MTGWVKRILGISRQEARGVVILLPFTVFCMLLPSLLLKLIYNSSELSVESSQLDSLAMVINGSSEQKDDKQFKNDHEAKKVRYYSFDPNLVKQKDLEAFGLKAYVIKNWLNYIGKGGRFKQVTDIKRVYGLTEADYKKLSQFVVFKEIDFEPKIESKSLSLVNDKKVKHEIFNINEADTSDLVSIKGIGKVYAKRIIGYRNLLGGFVSLNQLREVYGVKDNPELLARLDSVLYVDRRYQPSKIDINHTSEAILKAHPYIGRKARFIDSYRFQHGDFKSSDDLYKLKTLDSATVSKITPYIVFR